MKVLPAQFVKPYVKSNKNDIIDAEAIAEAVTRPTMRFVAVKSPEQQSLIMLHRVRLMLNRQRTQISNAIRAHISEFGVVAPVGRLGVERLLEVVADAGDDRVPEDARLCLQMLAAQLEVVKRQILGERLDEDSCGPDALSDPRQEGSQHLADAPPLNERVLDELVHHGSKLDELVCV